jgi:hypothetical protein
MNISSPKGILRQAWNGDLQTVFLHELAAHLAHTAQPVFGQQGVDHLGEVPQGEGVEQQGGEVGIGQHLPAALGNRQCL